LSGCLSKGQGGKSERQPKGKRKRSKRSQAADHILNSLVKRLDGTTGTSGLHESGIAYSRLALSADKNQTELVKSSDETIN
jgi:hypothetical protein